MPKQYICELCKKIFNQKCDYNKHINKKAPCITLNEMLEIKKSIVENTDTKRILINIFDKCLNALRDNEGLTGDKALRNMSYLLILKMIEPYMGNKIDIDEYDYDFSHIDDEFVSGHKSKLLEIVRFSKLSQEKEDNIPVIIKHLWDDILSSHPSTKNIFLKGKGFDIKHKSTYIKIINILNTLPETEHDVLGDAYEETIKSIMTGKVLGQFFTQPFVKKIMVKLISPQIYPDGKIDTCCDPTMGTGGFLIEYIKEILKQARIKNIEPDWDFIKNEGIYGKEIEPDTYQLAVSNMLISSGYMFEKLDRGDSIREPILRKFDNILANPPFGIKGLKYDDFDSSYKNEYVPIKTDNAVSLFIQAIIYMLKINGKCAVVLPDGQDLFSKNNATLVAIREYLLKTCDLKEIIYLPSGIFEHTSIKTCIFYFIKKREGTEVIEIKRRVSKTQKELGRDYKFSKTHQTTSVKFYDCNPDRDVKNLLVEVPIEKLASNSYSLNYAEYMKDDSEAIEYEEGVVVKTLGEVCEFQNGYSFKSIDYEKQNDTNIGILQIKSIQNGFIDENKITEYIPSNDKYKLFEIQKGDILIGLTGTFKIGLYNLDNKSYLNQRVGKITAKTGIIQKYIYYWYLCCDIEGEILKIAKGTAQANISTNDISNIKIPIPSLERQQEIVEECEQITKSIDTIKLRKEQLKCDGILFKKYYKHNELNEIYKNSVVKTLGEVCDINNIKKYETSFGKEFGKYKFYTGGANKIYYNDEYNIDVNTIILNKTNGSGKCNIFIDKNISCAIQTHTIQSKSNENETKYIYYYLSSNMCILEKGYIGPCHKNLQKTYLEQLKIPIPSLENQEKVVAYYEQMTDEYKKHILDKIDEHNRELEMYKELCVNMFSL